MSIATSLVHSGENSTSSCSPGTYSEEVRMATPPKSIRNAPARMPLPEDGWWAIVKLVTGIESHDERAGSVYVDRRVTRRVWIFLVELTSGQTGYFGVRGPHVTKHMVKGAVFEHQNNESLDTLKA